MWRPNHNVELASHRAGSLLVTTFNAAALLLASAASGAAIALHLAGAPQAGEHPPLHGAAATPAAIAPAFVEAPKIATRELPPAAQESAEAAAATPAQVSATKLAAWLPTRASPPDAERELTFAWGYAQRHPEALARTDGHQVTPTLAGSRTQGVERISKREPRRPPERQRASIARRDRVGIGPSGFFADAGRDAYQAHSYTEPQNADAARSSRRAQSSPGARHRSVSSSPRA